MTIIIIIIEIGQIAYSVKSYFTNNFFFFERRKATSKLWKFRNLFMFGWFEFRALTDILFSYIMNYKIKGENTNFF